MGSGRAVIAGDGFCTLEWAGKLRTFNCGRIGALRSLQAACDTSPMAVLVRLYNGTWFFDDCAEVIRLGLIGAGMSATKAARLVRRHIDNQPLLSNVIAAQQVLSAGLSWPSDDEIGPRSAGGAEAPEKIIFSQLYGNGAAIGFSPRDVDECTLWEFAACIDGYNRAQGGEQPIPTMDEDELEEMMERHREIVLH